ncbi:MAG TPA: hypothetical protein VE863_13560 [Pyrinomonadaceae bacterium]|nr:hypothetical protein [Pyrinomonadaceae bacterium]
MKTQSIFLRLAVLIIAALACGSARLMAQPQASVDEQNMAKAIDAAPDMAGKARALTEFMKKFPKSSLRPGIAQKAADQIRDMTDAEQKIAMAQQFKTIFNQPNEEEMIMPILLVAYSDAKKPDDAFSTGSAYLGQHPDSVSVLVELMNIGTEEAKRRNGKFVSQSDQYGMHAIELIEANKKPASMSDATWKEYTDLLPRIYQSVGVLAMVTGDRTKTQARLTKASQLDAKDPLNYLFLASSFNDAYQEAAKKYQAMPDGPAKTAELKNVLASLERVVDTDAHFIAVSDGNAQLANIRQQEMGYLETNYKFLHDGKTDGMQQLIDKYKAPVKPKDPFSLP